jgi:hypothetical protein
MAPNGARESVSVLAFRLLRWVPFETISDLVAEAKTQFAIFVGRKVWRRMTVNVAPRSGFLTFLVRILHGRHTH